MAHHTFMLLLLVCIGCILLVSSSRVSLEKDAKGIELGSKDNASSSALGLEDAKSVELGSKDNASSSALGLQDAESAELEVEENASSSVIELQDAKSAKLGFEENASSSVIELQDLQSAGRVQGRSVSPCCCKRDLCRRKSDGKIKARGKNGRRAVEHKATESRGKVFSYNLCCKIRGSCGGFFSDYTHKRHASMCSADHWKKSVVVQQAAIAQVLRPHIFNINIPVTNLREKPAKHPCREEQIPHGGTDREFDLPCTSDIGCHMYDMDKDAKVTGQGFYCENGLIRGLVLRHTYQPITGGLRALGKLLVGLNLHYLVLGSEETPMHGDLRYLANLRTLKALTIHGSDDPQKYGGDISGLLYLSQLRSVHIGPNVGGNLSMLESMSKLEELTLEGHKVRGSLRSLQKMSKLTYVDLTNTSVKGHLKYIQHTRLTDLSLPWWEIECSGSNRERVFLVLAGVDYNHWCPCDMGDGMCGY